LQECPRLSTERGTAGLLWVIKIHSFGIRLCGTSFDCRVDLCKGAQGIGAVADALESLPLVRSMAGCPSAATDNRQGAECVLVYQHCGRLFSLMRYGTCCLQMASLLVQHRTALGSSHIASHQLLNAGHVDWYSEHLRVRVFFIKHKH